MAIAKKYRRKIVVDERVYCWVVKDNGDIVTLLVELAQPAGAKLKLNFDPIRAFYNRETLSIRPAFVREAILNARAAGWVPERPGPVFWGATGDFRVGFETVGQTKIPLWNPG